MARTARLDAPGALHHVRARGIEKRRIFLDDVDRENFLSRLAQLVESGALQVLAWALMPNHVHLLVRTGNQPLHRSMRALLAGYATWFNRRHRRAGHLFQNRYKSSLCEDDAYFLTLVRYIHRNPLPSVVPNLSALKDYRFTGHSTLLGHRQRSWQDAEAVLARFSDDPSRARDLYEKFVAAGDDSGDRELLEGGGLVRQRKHWKAIAKLRRGRERSTTDERILGTPRFIAQILGDLNGGVAAAGMSCDELTERICAHLGVTREELSRRGRRRVVSEARRALSYLWTFRLGGSGRALAADLGLSPSSVHQAARKGSREAARWIELLGELPGPPGAKPNKP